MKFKKDIKINKRAAKNISAVLSQVFAMAMALVLVLLAMRYIVLHENYGSYMISPYEKSGDFQDTQTFHMVFQRELTELSHYLALCSQLETKGEYDPDRRVDVFEYVNRRDESETDAKKYPKLVYRVGDLIEWANYGFAWGQQEMLYEDARSYLSEEEMKAQIDEGLATWKYGEDEMASSEDGMKPENFIYEVVFVDEEFLPQNYASIQDLKTQEGVSLREVMEAVAQTAEDLRINYDEYLEKVQRFDSSKNLKYMFLDEYSNIAYTNLENKEELSVDQLKEGFTSSKTYLIYDYTDNTLQSRNLLLNHEAHYKSYFRDYKYCFPKGGTVYVAIQTKSSAAFGPYNSEDFYAVTDAGLKAVDASWEQMIVWATVFGIISLIMLIVFIVFQPKKKKEELTGFDRWFTEIAVICAGATICVIVGIGALFASACADHNLLPNMTIDQYNKGFLVSIYVAFTLLYVTFLLYMGSLVRRIKAKALWKGSLCYYLLHNTKKICGKFVSMIGKSVGILVNHKSFVVRTLIPYELFLVINALFILLGHNGLIGWGLALIFDIAVGVYLYHENKAREEIVTGITRICDGEVDYQIDTTYFFGENKVIAEAVNQIGAAVNKAVQISMKDERLKADLITNVSHDIKTPLTSIINYVDLLKRENIQGEKAQEYIRILDEKSQRLKQLTLDLVEASKISSGNITLEMSDINVKELLNQAIGEYEDKLSEKKLSVVTSYPEEEVIIRADSRRMWRVTENLLVNICKYSMEGTRVYVDVTSVKNSSAPSETVELVFKNISAQPLNIPAEELTERFIRGDVSRSSEGSGLGLSIAQNLTVAQGGEFKIYLDGDLFKVVLRFPRK